MSILHETRIETHSVAAPEADYVKVRLRGTVWEHIPAAALTYRVVLGAGHWIANTGVSPNALTYLSLVVAGAAGTCAAFQRFGSAAFFVVLSGLLDLLDGAVARAANRSTRYGALLDSTADRLAESLPLIGLVVAYSDSALAAIPALAMLGAVSVSYVRARAETLGAELPPLFMRRAERLTLFVASLLLGLIPVASTFPAPLLLAGVALSALLNFVGVAGALRAAQKVLEARPSSRAQRLAAQFEAAAVLATAGSSRLLGRGGFLARSPWFWPLLPVLYSLGMTLAGVAKPEQHLLAAACVALSYWARRSPALFLDVLPYILVGYAYDLLRFIRQAAVTPGDVLTCELRRMELRFFPVAEGMTAQDWFQLHHTRFADLVLAIPYAAFLFVVLGYALYLFFADRFNMRRFFWAFAIANFLAFALWMAQPAAPPWYVRAYGCVAHLDTGASAASLSRVDELLGFGYFSSFYARSNWAFGAIPSLHCAYPVIGLLIGWQRGGWATRLLHGFYVLGMFVAAIYWDHHWVSDGLVGWLTAVVAVGLASWLVPLLYGPESVERRGLVTAPQGGR